MTTQDTALERFKQEYSCSQSVFSALAERWNIGPEISLRVSAGFGGGIAATAQTCGCVTGAIMALGMSQNGIGPEENRGEKQRIYGLGRQFLREFQERNGSTICAGLLGCNISTPEGLAKARQEGVIRERCPKFVRDAVEIVESLLPAIAR